MGGSENQKQINWWSALRQRPGQKKFNVKKGYLNNNSDFKEEKIK